MEQTECSETSVYKIKTPWNYPKESIKHSGHGESLKSRTINLHDFNKDFKFLQNGGILQPVCRMLLYFQCVIKIRNQ